jgi:TldD protein
MKPSFTNDTLNGLFFLSNGLDEDRVKRIISQSLSNMEDGELFLEFCQSESLTFDDGILKNASYNTQSGFGLRSVIGETTGYAHSSELSEAALLRAAETVQAIRSGYSGSISVARAPQRSNRHLYQDTNPLQELPLTEKITLLQEIDSFARLQDKRVKQVSASLAGEWQAVRILRADGESYDDIRPLVRLNISVVVEQNGRMERGSFGCGGREHYSAFITKERWQAGVLEALRQAVVNLDSINAPAGEMQVVLGAGWPGILLHEAIGHGLEGDFNRKKTSAFSGLMGQQVAAKGVTVVDDGTIEKRRGSLSIDDEGTPTQRTVLIEDGILKGYMQDRMNARLMGVSPTGNGRRENFAYAPMPRMTNTFMLNGNHSQEEIIASVKKGIFAPHFGGGQVDITSGKFVFSASEAYLIENGKIGAPLKGATLIGNGPEALKHVKMIGNDLKLDPGIGTCGKAGQGVPVGVGQPSILLDKITVGGVGSAS